ncbi:MAG: hypothetical protein IJT47_00785 [Selenomonadaceae bacterium]|nr:hypothetical protein [Selenomonadaceae bacterium]
MMLYVQRSNAAGTEATITSDYTKKDFNVADYGTKIKTINASETSQGIYITANSLTNKIIGGDGADTPYAAKGTDTLTGDKISLDTAYTDVTLSGSDVFFTIGKGTLLLKEAKGKTLNVIDDLTLTNSSEKPVIIVSAIEKVDATKRTRQRAEQFNKRRLRKRFTLRRRSHLRQRQRGRQN